MLDDVPNDIGVHGKVIVNQNVSHAHYLRPRYALLTVAKLLRQRACRLTNKTLRSSFHFDFTPFVRGRTGVSKAVVKARVGGVELE